MHTRFIRYPLILALLCLISISGIKAQSRCSFSLQRINDTALIYKQLLAAEKQIKTSCFHEIEILANQLLPVCDSLHYKAGLIACNNLLGLINGFKGNADTASLYFQKALTLSKGNKDDREYWTKVYMGWIYRDKGDYKTASSLLYSVMEYAGNHNNKALLCCAQIQLGQIAVSLKNEAEANNFFSEVLKIAEAEKLPEFAALALLNLGEMALRQKHFPQAQERLLKSEKLLRENALIYDLAHVYNSLARVAMAQENFTQAEYYYNKSGEIKKEFGDLHGLAVLYNNLGDLYAEQYKDSKAIAAFKESATLANKIGSADIKRAAFLNLSILMEYAGKYKEALDYQKAATSLHDSLWNIAKTKEILALDEKYKVAQREKYILSLHATAQISEANARSKTRQRNLWIAGFVFICILIVIGYYAFLQKIRLNRIITLKNEELQQLNKTKDYLFHVIGHDIRLPLSGLSRIADLINYCLQHNKTDRLLKVGDDVRLTVQRIDHLLSNLLTWGLSETGQMAFHQEKIPVARVFEQVASDFATELKKKEIHLSNDTTEQVYAFADNNSLKVILRNMLANAIKFTPVNSTIHIAIKGEGDQCLIKIRDQGEGISTTKVNKLFSTQKKELSYQGPEAGMGVGLFICQQMAVMNQGSIYVGNPDEEGAEFICALPLAES
ncbi:Signal transduction histidine kinase [Chitinophaga sp. CF118]|uniref:ATP-binding protein n=1 Tax=Chitinophaga sp. CF118 TaxID=1884367 RepID=UPI0008EBE6BA|nr:tetratricopeptide repeat protein [Chitinophaga sp. CF118]SFD99142.1 Signal transduction histidine kinase [Chitinophaga sp. CF118]